jgi:hypothetical protein
MLPSLPQDVRLLPGVGNGQLATQVYHDTIYMNGLYSGRWGDSHRARIPSTVSQQFNLSNPIKDRFILDMKHG